MSTDAVDMSTDSIDKIGDMNEEAEEMQISEEEEEIPILTRKQKGKGVDHGVENTLDETSEE
jgi:hypothetical protein